MQVCGLKTHGASSLKRLALHRVRTATLRRCPLGYYGAHTTRTSRDVVAQLGVHTGVGLLLEADGAVLDMQLDGHRVAFNNAFHSIGMDCVSWTPPIYNDLLSQSDGTGEGLIVAYYSLVGWPVMLPTAERPAFVKKVHQLKEKELAKLLAKDGVPLREDVKQVIADAVSSGAAVSLLCGTQCTQAEAVAQSCVRLLGPELEGAVRIFTFTMAPGEAAGEQDAGDETTTPTLSQLLSAAQGDLKQRAAMHLVCSWKGDGQSSERKAGIAMDPSLLAASGSQQRVTPEFLAALLATTGVAASNTLAVAASNGMLQAAAGAGLYPVVVPRKFASQGSFPAAKVKFAGFGAGLATWQRLRNLLANGAAAAK